MERQTFETNVVTGADLLALSENVRGWKKRDCYRQLDAYLHSGGNDRVCLLFGLRRTGKTTMLRQAVLDMSPEDVAKTAYIKATVLDTMASLNRDMKRLRSAGFRYVLLDEITLIQEFGRFRRSVLRHLRRPRNANRPLRYGLPWVLVRAPSGTL